MPGQNALSLGSAALLALTSPDLRQLRKPPE
jgi:hypothetical protein